MTEEYHSILKNDVWDIVTKLDRNSVVTFIWLFKIKHVANGSVDKFKSKFVVRGFSQKEGIDYEETFSPVSKYTTIRSIISLVPVLG